MKVNGRKTRILAILALGALIAGVSSCTEKPKQVSDKTRIIVADAKTTHHLNLYTAQELGLFAKYGLEIEIVSVDENAASRDLVISGQADVFWSCPTVAIASIANGAPLKIISQVKKPCTSVLVVSPDSPINEYSDLAGKNIGGISPTCEAVLSLDIKARQNGGSFILEKLAGGPAIAALEAGKVDGVILEEPHVSIAQLKGYKILFPEASANIPCRTINARTAFLKSNAEALKRFIKAVDEANEIILADPVADRIVEIAVKYTGAPAEAIRHGNDRLKFRTNLDESGLFALADELVTLNTIKQNPKNALFADEFRTITWN